MTHAKKQQSMTHTQENRMEIVPEEAQSLDLLDKYLDIKNMFKNGKKPYLKN